MDTIEIRVESHHGQAVPKPWAAVFGLAGGTIGSGGQNRLVLPDADAQVDRVHAMVRLQADKVYLVNLCERRSLRVGDEALAPGQEALLPLGARMQIGPYGLRAATPGSAWTSPTSTPDAASIGDEAAGALAADDNPFAFIGRVEGPAPARAAAGPSASPSNAPVIPDDFDPFARDVERERRERDPWAEGLPAQNLAEMAAVHDGLLRTLPPIDRFGQAAVLAPNAVQGLPASLDPNGELDPLRLFDDAPTQPGLAPESARLLRGSAMHQAVRLPQAASPAPRPAVAAEPAALAPRQAAGLPRLDGLDLTMFDRSPSPPAVEPAAVPEAAVFAGFDADLAPTQIQTPRPATNAPALDLNLDLAPAPTPTPAPRAADAPMPTPAPHDRAAAGAQPAVPAADVQALLQAFVEGLGLPPERATFELTPELLRRFGEVLRTAVQGTMDLLQARAEVKREFRADVTIMAQRANNPLKFLPDAEGVLLQMLGQTLPGFARPVPAMREAYRDLRVHQHALLAGIRAAYAEGLSRLDPAALQKPSDAADGLLARLGRTSRKAALWDGYCERYASLRRQAEDELTAFSGRSFVKAYDAAADAAFCDDELPPGSAR
jgi:FHA domain-containing protein